MRFRSIFFAILLGIMTAEPAFTADGTIYRRAYLDVARTGRPLKEFESILRKFSNDSGSFSVVKFIENREAAEKEFQSDTSFVSDLIASMRELEYGAKTHCKGKGKIPGRLTLRKFKAMDYGQATVLDLHLNVECVPDNWVARAAYQETLTMIGNLLSGNGEKYIADRTQKIQDVVEFIQNEIDTAKCTDLARE